MHITTAQQRKHDVLFSLMKSESLTYCDVFICREKAHYAQKLKECFYVETREWKRRTIHRGMMLFFQVLSAFVPCTLCIGVVLTSLSSSML